MERVNRKISFQIGSEKDLLLKEIEASRNKMNLLARNKPLSSNEIIEISTYLDYLLNEYDQRRNKKTAAF
ncbi:Spo0E family sporulation regulatory protein-aspartic acid phosphatase [Bacillus hwajinpoensis]|uniref:Spo0E family sporulation regulatory protein-aspartic acid phosphatase n=1 Tax=Guptibacillus hwajinpoensis TaxID=208199 RepID=A0A845F5B5_9BACL|nr:MULTISPECIES: aspartyl-phosphate phosphatase Spo0E family protein [Bacillaceae]MCA0993515.1 aspartyl-phosphate phosphatase Spo0E family protein [Pseudalkalibacillus hwajinpoensis]MYL66010.1 Spo0E family sporulation regulatory protein-aspartic acid phosphatase [Pseudalkalibacillus hwajinpoensis]PFG02717.1 Spo0E like sporulation regulatory protein [Bacillus sp. es.036]